MAEQTSGRPAEAKAEKAPYVRTKVRTRNPAKGVYRTLNGEFEIRQSEKAGQWDLFRKDGEKWVGLNRELKGWDNALTFIVEAGLATVEALNTAPAKPKPAAPAKAEAKPVPTEAKEPSERRSGATGPAPRKTRGPGEAIHVRKTRAQRVG